MQKKISRQCHCEGAKGDCGNLKRYDTKTVYFLREDVKQSKPFISRKLPQPRGNGISVLQIQADSGSMSREISRHKMESNNVREL